VTDGPYLCAEGKESPPRLVPDQLEAPDHDPGRGNGRRREAGERLVARADGPGRIILEREDDVLSEFAGALPEVYGPDELAALRDEWD